MFSLLSRDQTAPIRGPYPAPQLSGPGLSDMAGSKSSWLLGLLGLLLGVAANTQDVSRECKELGKTFNPIENQGHYVPGCYAEVQPKFLLHQTQAYTCLLANSSISLGTVWPCIRGRVEHLVVIVHGFTGGKDNWWIEEMLQKIFAHDPRANVAVLVVDWSHGGGFALDKSFYKQAAANTRYVGAATALVVRQIDQMERPLDLTVHCIGHSLGAHVCGFLGASLEGDSSYGRKLDRITGSDPAGPLFLEDMGHNRPFTLSNPDWRLDPTDATRVDVIHTDGDSLGTMKPLGHTDFYGGVTSKSFGSNQACCYPPQCDHEESISTLLSTITDTPYTYDMVACSGPSNATLTGCVEIEATPALGYFYDGSQPGVYGFHLPRSNKPRQTVLEDALMTGLSPIINSPICKSALSVVTGLSKACPLELIFNHFGKYSELCATVNQMASSDMMQNMCETCQKSEMSWENVEIVNQITHVNIQLEHLNDQLNQFFDHSLIRSLLIDEMKAYKYIKNRFSYIQLDTYGLIKNDSYSDTFVMAALRGTGAGGKSLGYIRSTLFDAMTGKIPLQGKSLFLHSNMCHEYQQLKEILFDTFVMDIVAKQMSDVNILPVIFEVFKTKLVEAEDQMVKDCPCPIGKVLTYHNIEKTVAAKVNSSLFECTADIMIETVNIVERLERHDATLFEDTAFCAEHPGWAEWGSWGEVTHGARTRNRDCACPPPRNIAPVNSPCPHTQASETQEAISGGWGAWSQWSTSRRSKDKLSRRRCNNPARTNGGLDCSGPSSRVCRTSEGWTCGEFGTYREHPYYLNKDACEKRCSALGGQLPTVHSRAEADELDIHCSNWVLGSDDELWLGAVRTPGGNLATFSWENGEEYDYNWTEKYPYDWTRVSKTGNCVKMTNPSSWRFWPCNRKSHCVCVQRGWHTTS